MANYGTSSMKYQLSSLISAFVKELSGLDVEPEIVIPNDLEKGDLATNIALASFTRIKNQELGFKNPMELGEKIIEKIREDSKLYSKFAKIELANPGFINFWFSNTLIEEQIGNTLENCVAKPETEFKGLIFEFGDLNPFKEPHIGHVRNLVLGESLVRLFEYQGVKVIRANYQGDVGLHVAKAIFGIMKDESEFKNLENANLEEKARFLGKSYALGAKAYEEGRDAKHEIISINNKVYTKDSKIMEIWEKGRRWSLEYFEQLYKKLGIKYEKYYFESQTAQSGLEIVKANVGKVFEENEGAIIFRGEKEGLHTRVFVTGENYATYEAKDLALAVLKNNDFSDINKSIIMTANEQVEYFRVMLKALEKIDKNIADKTSHVSFGFVNLKDGKMSSRTGKVVSANWLLDETKNRLKDGYKEVSESVLEDLSVSAVKWSMLKFSRESNISFSIEESIDLAGNSGPYMLYTYARISSLLKKAQNSDFEVKSVKIVEDDLLALSRLICQQKIVIKNAADNFSPNYLTEYLFCLAQNFNTYYEKEKIIGSEKETEKLAVISAVGKVLKTGLNLLGINAPEKI